TQGSSFNLQIYRGFSSDFSPRSRSGAEREGEKVATKRKLLSVEGVFFDKQDIRRLQNLERGEQQFLSKIISNNKLNYLAIADYYPYEITEFFNLCKAKKIKPIWGVKIFLQEKPAGKKISATLYPQNNKGYKEVIQKLFAPDSPPDRTFSPIHILSTFSKNCLIVLEAQKIEEIKHLAAQ
ncbi:8952_t:CDS:2, partial [Racocetra persica]